jgi:hypothetical protein
MEVMGRRGRNVSSYWMTLRKRERVLDMERGRSHCVGNWQWKGYRPVIRDAAE